MEYEDTNYRNFFVIFQYNYCFVTLILTTPDFDATKVDPLSVQFGPDGATEAHGKGHIEDVDGDGDSVLILHFKTQDTGIQPGDTEASLIEMTFDGTVIYGSDSIMTVPKQ